MMVPKGVRGWWRRITTSACNGCGVSVPVSDYVPTGETRKGSWWAGSAIELECPECGTSFWVKK